MAEDEKRAGSEYKKRPLWQWILIYLVVGVIIYALIYYFFLGGGGYSFPGISSIPSPGSRGPLGY